MSAPASTTVVDTYHRKLIVFLSVATFFEGYDMFALAQILPNLRAEFHLDETQAGILLSVVSAGTVLAGFLVRLADRVGRKTVLSITIAGYTIFSLLTALSPNIYVFALAQLLARIFLIGEWAVAMVIAAEEFPAEKRGTLIGVIQACATFGGIACAALVPFLVRTSLGWRAVYVAGAIPLLLVAVARRGLRETRRFTEQVKDRPADANGALARGRLVAMLRGPYRVRIIQLGIIWSLSYICTQAATMFWKEFAVHERAFTDKEVGGSLTIAAIVAMPIVFYSGRILDVLGRRVGGALVFVVAAVGVALAYLLHGRVELTIGLVLAIAGTNAVLPLLNAYTAELFPTEMRADAFAVSNNVLGRIGYVLAPTLVGVVAQRTSWSFAVSCTSLSLLLALALLWKVMPETKGRELEETSRVS